MDLSNPWTILSGLVLGLIGMGLFMYGKKQTNFTCLGAGVALCVIPYFITSMLILWLVSAGILGGVYYFGRE